MSATIQLDSDVIKSLDPQHEKEAELPDMKLDEPDKSYFEGLFPKGQVHLLAGPSGAGKTRLAFQMYRALTSLNGEWLGRKTIPCAWAYVSGDRATNSVKETQKGLGVNFKVFSLVDQGIVGADLASDVFPKLTNFYGYRPNFVYIDGFTSLVPQGKLNEYQIVAKWLANLQMYAQRKNLTIVGACHTTKVREGEAFKDPRQRIAGSVAWAAYSESVVILEGYGNNPHKRRVILLPRNGPEEGLFMEFQQDGSLKIADGSKDSQLADQFVLGNIYNALGLKTGEEIYYLKLWLEAQKKQVNKRTFDRWLAKQVESGGLERVKKGVYVKVDISKSEGEE